MSGRRLDDSFATSEQRVGWLRRGLAWWRSRGPATQALVPGGYAWAVTVAPVGMSRDAGVVAMLASGLGLASFVAGVALESRWPSRVRAVTGWGLAASAIVTWAAAPDAKVLAFDAPWGIAGMLGWALFAFVIASPARESAETKTSEPLTAKAKGAHLDRAVLALAVTLTVALEIPGWRAEQRDRALLLRLVALAGGLAFVTSASAILERYHAPRRSEGAVKRRWRLRWSDVVWVATACVLAGAGVTYELWRRP